MRLLEQLRDNVEVFGILASAIDESNEGEVNEFATEIVENLLTDFESVEISAVKVLQHVEYLMKDLVKSWVFHGALFERNRFVNKLIKAYLLRTENREYLTFLFGPIIDALNRDILDTNNTVSAEEEKIVKQIKYSDLIINAIITNINSIPLNIRYLLKVIEAQIPSKKIRQVLIELLFENWWLPCLMLPIENNIIAFNTNNTQYHLNMLSIIRILKATLYNRPIDDESIFAALVNNFVQGKRRTIKKYLNKLLDIKYIVKDVKENDISLVGISVCMSIESINFIVGKLNAKVDELTKVNSNCANYLAQINSYLAQNSIKKFIPNHKLFKSLLISKATVQEFDEGRHYLLFQDIYLKERAQSTIFLNEFQTYLQELLYSIDLSSYYSNIDLENSADDFIKLLQHVAKHPEHFFITSDKHCEMQLLANKLFEFFTKGEVRIEMMNELARDYLNKVSILKEKNNSTEHMLRLNIKTLQTRLDYLTQRKNFLYLNLIPAIYANKIILHEKAPFEIIEDPNTVDESNTEYSLNNKVGHSNIS